jgi:predicted metal-dependent HD superfamily phosphohydrolase
MIKFIIENWLALGGTIGSVVLWAGKIVYDRRNWKNEAKSSELENIKTVRVIEKELLADMEQQVNKLIEANNYYRKVITEQNKDLSKYKLKYGELNEQD